MNLMVGSPDGIADIEANPHEVRVARSDGSLCHANHYSEPSDYAPDDTSSEYYVNSCTRWSRMKDILQVNDGKLDLETLENMLADHQNEPNAICRHLSSTVTGNARTFDAMIFVAEKREAWIARDNPCTSRFVRYQV